MSTNFYMLKNVDSKITLFWNLLENKNITDFYVFIYFAQLKINSGVIELNDKNIPISQSFFFLFKLLKVLLLLKEIRWVSQILSTSTF